MAGAIFKLARSYESGYSPPGSPTAEQIGTLQLRASTTGGGPQLFIGVADDAAATNARWEPVIGTGGGGTPVEGAIVSEPEAGTEQSITAGAADDVILQLIGADGQTEDLLQAGRLAVDANGYIAVSKADVADQASALLLGGIAGEDVSVFKITDALGGNAHLAVKLISDPFGDGIDRASLSGLSGNEVIIDNCIVDGGVVT